MSEESKVVYSSYWQTSQTGQTLFRMTMPLITNGTEHRVLYEPPSAKDRIFETKLAALKMVPNEDVSSQALASLLKAIENSHLAGKPWGSAIAGIGNFSIQAAKLLPKVSRTASFVDRAKKFWIWIESSASDQDFKEWIRALLFDHPGILNYQFQPTASGTPLVIEHIFDIREEQYINDEAIRAAFEVFSDFYEEKGRYLFIPPTKLSCWISDLYLDWKEDLVKAGQVEKAFAIVNLRGCHWGVIEVDFNRRKISSGDSLSWENPKDATSAVREWIRRCGVDVERWDLDIGRFHVPQQPAGSGSCAVNALNAVETSVNPAIEEWTHSRSSYHRLRLLRLITGYTKVGSQSIQEG